MPNNNIKAFVEGKKIILRSLVETDLLGNWPNWFNDSQVCEFNNHHRFPVTQHESSVYLDKVRKDNDSLVLAIVERKESKHIGNISLQKIDWINRNAEFAVIIGDHNYWGKGYAYEASEIIINQGFNELNLNRIYCGTSELNIGMQKLALKLGFQKEGKRRQAFFKKGKYIDIFEYGLLVEEFRTKLI